MLNIQENISLADKNTYKIGGKSRFYVEPESTEQLVSSFDFAAQKNLPVFVLGKGSNVLISDYGWQGLTINTSVSMNEIHSDGTIISAACGVSLNTVISQSISNGFSGMEELSGIPGTVGGAVIMNAGAYNDCIADTFDSAVVYDINKGTQVVFDKSEAMFGYRTSAFKKDGIFVLNATFRFTERKNINELKTIQHTILAQRKAKQPLEYPNCGSVFKRPPGNFAGTLIEKCGLKGLHSGDIQVSEKHANFIVNKGNGRAEDVRIVIRTVQKRVFEEHGIRLEPEVIFMGQFDEEIL